MEEKLNPQESLKLITAVISQTRDNIKQYSFIFLLWGWLLVIASFTRFLLQVGVNFKYHFITFPILTATGIIISILHSRKSSTAATETYLNAFIKNLWIGIAIGFITIVLVSVIQKIEPFAYTLILSAIGTMVTGITMRFKPLIYGSIFFFISAISCVFLPSAYKVLINGIAVIFGYIIPGYLLKNLKE